LNRVALLAGVHASPWHLQSWAYVAPHYEVSALVSERNVFDAGSAPLPVSRIKTIGEIVPGRIPGGLVRRISGDRYLGLAGHLADVSIVHSYELGSWFAAQAAGLRDRLGFKLVLTAWETIPFGASGRTRRARGYRRQVLAATDLFLPTTERARAALVVEGVPEDRIVVNPPGIDTDRFAQARTWHPPPGGEHVVLSVGRLVPEKGHHDLLRAAAQIRGAGMTGLRIAIAGNGPAEKNLRALARELNVDDIVDFVGGVGYAEMPALYAGASCLVLASLPTPGWEEQFGMVLAEAMAAHLPIVASASGAIPEVVGDSGTLFPPGDWRALADALVSGPLARPPGQRQPPDAERLRLFGLEAAGTRLRAAYDRVLR
jgi:glycosyltransferase involved in cell wall biosynthesis